MRSPRILIAVVLSFLFAVPARAARVEIILDVSGSMRASMGPESKMEAARKAIRATVLGIDPGSVVGLRLYGHRAPQEPKAESCRDTELVVPFQPLDRTGFMSVVERAQPRGQTPLTYSLEQAAQDFGEASDEERAIILVSDGAESCGGDPAAAARALRAKGFMVKVHTIGFDVDAAAQAQLKAVSDATGGEYVDARNAEALAQTLTRLTQRSLIVNKSEDTLGIPIRGGDGYETAVAIEPGKLYRLDHHQRKDQYDYFYFEVKGNQKIKASIETGQVGVEIRGETFQESSYPYAGITLQGPDRQKLGSDEVMGRGGRKEIQGNVRVEGRAYLLVGNPYGDQHKDSRFQLSVTAVAGDGGGPSDAGDTEAAATLIRPGSFTGMITTCDDQDFFKFKVDPQARYSGRLRFSAESTLLEISLTSEDGTITKSDTGSDTKPLVVSELNFPKGGNAVVRVRCKGKFSGSPETAYELVLVQEGGTSPEAAATENAPPSGPPLLGRLVSFVLWSGVPLMLGLFVGVVIGYLFGRRGRK